MNSAPKLFNAFISSLQKIEAERFNAFDEHLAKILRMQASTKDYGAIMTSGKSALPYVPWLVDGMIMSNKLIIHLSSEVDSLHSMVDDLVESDIRISSHYQDQATFTKDISEHRLDILLLTEDALPEINNWLDILSDAGLLVLIAPEESRLALMKHCSDDYFIMNDKHLFISRKGSQHRKKRRRSRHRMRHTAEQSL